MANIRDFKIFIDPGHGGTDPGAVANGLQEKVLALNISNYLIEQVRSLWCTNKT